MDETKRMMSGGEVYGALRARRLRQSDLARAAGIGQTDISAVLAGDKPLTPKTRQAIEQAIVELKLYEPVPWQAGEPMFQIALSEPSGAGESSRSSES
jgi:transcriptional regulator with XRE-family HTH domain